VGIPELIAICESRINYLNTLLGSASCIGDGAEQIRLEETIIKTQETLRKLRELLE